MRKLAISNLAWSEHEDDNIYQLMTKAGIFNLEISPFRDSAARKILDRESSQTLKNQLRPHGIQVVALQSLLYRFPELVLFADEAVREKMFKHLNKLINFAHNLGANVLVFGCPKNKLRGKLEYDKAFMITTVFFKRLAERLSECNINLCIEPTPSIYGADFIRNTEEAVSLIKSVNSSAVKLNMDIGALITNKENVEKSILVNMPYIGHIHISEPFLKIINSDFSFHNKIARTINKSSYTGNISIEMLPADIKNLQTIQNTLSFISKIYS